jgi:hypothetical protein
MKNIHVIARSLGLVMLVQLLGCSPHGLAAQQAPPGPQAAALPLPFGYVEQVLRALDASQEIIYQAIADSPAGARGQVDESLFQHLVRDGVAAGQLPTAMSPVGEGGQAEAPLPADVQALLDRTDALYWSVLSLMAGPDPSDLDRRIEDLLSAYGAETEADAEPGLSTRPADMAVVAESTPAGAFQEAYPRLHGLMWAQTWLRLAVFEPLVLYPTPEARQAGLTAVLARFWGMLEEPPLRFPTAMPMAPTVAQNFTYLSPAAAAIFENEDMLRGSIGDILVSEPAQSRTAALQAAAKGFQDGGYRRISRFAWRQMAVMHGVGNQGGFAIGIVTPPEHGMGMTHSMGSVMPGMSH